MSNLLTNEVGLLLRLLDDADWKERIVEEFLFGSGEHVRVVSTYQLVVTEAVMATVVENVPEHARLVLPLGTRDKRPLLNLAVQGPERADALLLPRDLTAELQATYLEVLLEAVGAGDLFGPETKDLLEAICVFSPALSEHFVVVAGDWHEGIAGYLTSGLDMDPGAIGPSHVKDWCERAATPTSLLLSLLDEPSDRSSSAEQVLLALPSMRDRPASIQAIDELLDQYHQGVAQLSHAGADDFLRLLAEYGRRWQVLVETDVPIGQRCKVRMAEDRPFNPQPGGRSRQRFASGDASSGHLEVRVMDHSVRLGKRMRVRDMLGSELKAGLLEAELLTPEAGSVYSSQTERPPLVLVDVGLRLRRELLAIPFVFALIALLASTTALLLPANEQLATALGVLAVPITVTAALLIVREQSPLAARLQTWPRRLIAGLTCLLWAAVLTRLLGAGADLPPW